MNWQFIHRWYWRVVTVLLLCLFAEMARHPWLMHAMLWPW